MTTDLTETVQDAGIIVVDETKFEAEHEAIRTTVDAAAPSVLPPKERNASAV